MRTEGGLTWPTPVHTWFNAKSMTDWLTDRCVTFVLFCYFRIVEVVCVVLRTLLRRTSVQIVSMCLI